MRLIIGWIVVLSLCFNIVWADEQSDYDRATQLYKQGEQNEAKERFESFLAQYPESKLIPGALFMYAQLETNPNRAMTIYQKIVDEYSKSEFAVSALFEVGQYHYSMGQYLTAIDTYKKLLKSSEDSELSCKGQYWLASAEYATQQYSSAQSNYQSVIDHYPGCEKAAWAMLGVGRCSTRLRQFREAELTFRTIPTQYSDPGILAAALYAIAENAELSEQQAYAIESYERVVNEFPTTQESALARQKLIKLKGSAPPPSEAAPAEPPVVSETSVADTVKADDKPITFTIQIGAFRDLENAEKEMRRIRAVGYAAEVIDRSADNPKVPYLVWVGVFESREEAEHIASRLKEDLTDLSTFIRSR